MSVRRRGSQSVAGLLSLGLAVAVAVSAELREIPRPLLDNLEPAVRDQLLEERAAVDERLAQNDDPEALAAALGELGRLYYLNDLYPSAEAAFRNALEVSPGKFDWHYFLGTIYFAEARFEEAESELAAALEIDADYLPAWIQLGRVDLDLSKIDDAERAFTQALELDSGSAAAVQGLGRVAFERGEYEVAIERFTRALELQPEANRIHYQLGLAYRELGDREKALEHLKQNQHQGVRYEDPLIQSLYTFVRSAKLHFNSAIELLQQNRPELAVEQLRMAIEKNPDNFNYHHNLAAAYGLLGRQEEAIAAYRRALELNPEYPNSRFNLAMMLVKRGEIEEAAGHLELAHRYDPGDLVAHTEWATALSQLGQRDRALAELEAVLDVDPGNGKALINLAAVQAQLGRLTEAEATLAVLLEGDANDEEKAAVRLRLGKIFEDRGEEERALASYRRALELEEALPDAHSAVAGILARRRSFSEAADHFARAVELRPEDLSPHFGQGLALLLSERYTDARAALEASVEVHPEHWPLVHLLSRLLATAPETTVRDGQRALELAQNVFEKQQNLEYAETIAMALAEVGRFDAAIQWQTDILAEARRRQAFGALATLERRLEQYRRGEPVRAPWLG